MTFPYSFNVAGFELPAQALVPHIQKFSYCLIGIASLAVAFYFPKRSRRSLFFRAAILLTIWVLVSVRQIFRQPPLLLRLSEENQAVPVIRLSLCDLFPRTMIRARKFQNTSTCLLPLADWLRRSLSSGRVVLLWPGLISGSLFCHWPPAGRAGSGGAGTYLSAHRCADHSGYSIGYRATLFQPRLFSASRRRQRRVDRCLNEELSEQEIADYRKAMKWDRWYTSGIEVYGLIGRLEGQVGLAKDSGRTSLLM